jgi:phage terminase small subunit
MNDNTLTPKRKLFAEAIVAGKTQVEAFEIAGYTVVFKSGKDKGEPKPKELLGYEACAVANEPCVKAYIEELMKEASKSAIFDAKRTLEALSEIAGSDIGDYFAYEDNCPRFKRFNEMTPEQRRPIKTAKFDGKTGHMTEFALEGKTPVLVRFSDIYGQVTNKVEHSYADSAVFEAMSRAMGKNGVSDEVMAKVVSDALADLGTMPG